MSTTYSTVSGDTFEGIARKQYGTETEAALISGANPGILEPFTVGISLVIPDQPGAPTNERSLNSGDDPDEVAISIETTRFKFWDSVSIVRSLDSVSTVEFGAPFTPESEQFRDTFRPFTFKKLFITVGGVPLFTGRMVGVNPSTTPSKRSITVNGYALPGTLSDCSISPGLGVEYRNLALDTIARILCRPFGINLDIRGDMGAAFDQVATSPGGSVMGFLAKLAQQRGLVLSSNAAGELLIWQSITVGVPVAVLEEGETPLVAISARFSPQAYFSTITGTAPSSPGRAGGQHTERNPHLTGVVRPHSFEIPDGTDGDIPETVKAKMGRMFGNAAAYSARVDTWRTPLGDLWEPNTLIQITAPGAMIYNSTTFLVRSVLLTRTATEQAAQLELVLPGAFSGEIPTVLPWA